MMISHYIKNNHGHINLLFKAFTSHPDYVVPVMNINIRPVVLYMTGVNTLVLMGNRAKQIGEA